jgi:uncharacterized protein (DUF1330 family)
MRRVPSNPAPFLHPRFDCYDAGRLRKAQTWSSSQPSSISAVGGSIIQGIHAQTTAPTYAVIDISTITEGFKALVPKAGLAVAAFGGKFIVRSENITASDGTSPMRFVIIAFDSLEKAKAWDASAAQKEVTAMRMKSSTSRQFLVEGMPQ